MTGPKAQGDGAGDEEIFAEINITPLTDIFLVLLIIFMVTSSVMASDQGRGGMRVNLPKGASRELAPGSKDVTVAITTEGKIMMDGQEVGVDTLRSRLEAAHAQNPETQVIVQADESAHHGRVVAVMELARAAGLHRLAIATRRAK